MCHSGGLFVELTDSDKSDPLHGVVCLKLSDIEDAARILNAAARIARFFV